MADGIGELLGKRTASKPWTGTFEQYLGMVTERPSIADMAHTRVYKAVMQAGVEEKDGKRRYPFFDGEIFGIDRTLSQVMDFFRSAGEGMDTKRRLLLLLGPTGTSKSSLTALLKQAVERYSHTDEGAVYSIAGCPLHEEPLHLLADDARKTMREQYGVQVEGGLCPVCQWRLDEEWSGDIASVPVERIYISEAHRVGIGSFAPGDPKTVSLEDLVGGMDLVKVAQYGSEGHPMSFRFDGALEASSRGIFEAIEAFKWPVDLLFPLLTLIQERQIKAGRFPLFYADEAVIAHTNLSEYERFESDAKNEAIQSRTHVIQVPYVLRIDDEVRIYEKLIRQSATKAHLAPHALRTAALWSVMTRLEERQNISLRHKAKVYNGEERAEHNESEIEDWQKQGREKGEGMRGIGPRPVISALSQALSRKEDGCLNTVDVLRALANLHEHVVGKFDKDASEKLLAEARDEYTQAVTRDVQRAYVEDFDSAAQTLLANYLDNAQASIDSQKLRDPITHEARDADENLMRGLEDHIAISDAARKEFRREILSRLGTLARRGEVFRWDSHPRLKEAIEKRLFTDLAGTLKATITVQTPDKEQREKVNGVRAKLIASHGYCESCADAALRYVGSVMGR